MHLLALHRNHEISLSLILLHAGFTCVHYLQNEMLFHCLDLDSKLYLAFVMCNTTVYSRFFYISVWHHFINNHIK